MPGISKARRRASIDGSDHRNDPPKEPSAPRNCSGTRPPTAGKRSVPSSTSRKSASAPGMRTACRKESHRQHAGSRGDADEAERLKNSAQIAAHLVAQRIHKEICNAPAFRECGNNTPIKDLRLPKDAFRRPSIPLHSRQEVALPPASEA